jgi:hypothetical protein
LCCAFVPYVSLTGTISLLSTLGISKNLIITGPTALPASRSMVAAS